LTLGPQIGENWSFAQILGGEAPVNTAGDIINFRTHRVVW